MGRTENMQNHMTLQLKTAPAASRAYSAAPGRAGRSGAARLRAFHIA